MVDVSGCVLLTFSSTCEGYFTTEVFNFLFFFCWVLELGGGFVGPLKFGTNVSLSTDNR